MATDVVVIGGGIVGASCAYYLSKEGIKVHLLEKGSLGCGASKAGMMHVVSWEEPEIHLKLAKASKKLYQELNLELSSPIEFRQTGSIAIIEKPEQVETFKATFDRLRSWGLNCKFLTPRELIEMEPNITPDIAGGVFFGDDAQVNPLYTTLALASDARKMGAIIDTFNEVIGFEFNNADHSVSAVLTKRDRIPAGAVIIASGAWSHAVGNLAGLNIPVEPRKGVLAVTVPVPEGIINSQIILTAGYMESVNSGSNSSLSVAANIQRAVNGNLVLGTTRQMVGFDREVDPYVMANVLKRCLRFFPVIAEISVIRTWAGFRPYTPDLLPIISPVESMEGVYVATGHEGIGITEGPITGKLITQMITGQDLEFPLDDVSLKRFEK